MTKLSFNIAAGYVIGTGLGVVAAELYTLASYGANGISATVSGVDFNIVKDTISDSYTQYLSSDDYADMKLHSAKAGGYLGGFAGYVYSWRRKQKSTPQPR